MSAAIDRLYDAMWGGVERPDRIADIKKTFRRTTREANGRAMGGLRISSVGLASWRAKAIAQIQDAVLSGELAVFAVPDPNVPDDEKPTLRHMSPVMVPPVVLARIIGTTVRLPDGSMQRRLPERVTAPRPSLVAGQPNAGALLDALRFGSLAFAVPDYKRWFLKQRAKRQWPSQAPRHSIQQKQKPRKGRPPIQSNGIESRIEAALAASQWRASDGFPMLRRLLQSELDAVLPSVDTLRRIADRMYERSGDTRWRRRKNRTGGSQSRKSAARPDPIEHM